MAQMPGMVNAMATGKAQAGFNYANQNDIYNMDDASRGDYWRRLNSYGAQGGYGDQGYKDYLGSLNGDLNKEYQATQARNPLVGAASDYNGDRNFFLSQNQLNAGKQIANGGFQQKSAKDIYAMNDADRTNYWQQLQSASQWNGDIGSSAKSYIDSLSPDLKQDFQATASGSHNFYLSPEQRQRGLQQVQAQEFRQNIPGMQQQMTDQLRGQVGGQISRGAQNINQSNSNRGLLYSGINEGQKAGFRAGARANFGQAVSGINQQLNTAADTMDQQAIQTGQGIQQNAQQIQNQVYSQALARMNAQNQVAGAGMGLLGTAAIIAATGGFKGAS